MTWSKVAFYAGIGAAVLTAWATGDGLFSVNVGAVLAFASAALIAFGSAITSGINGPSHKVAWVTVVASVAGVFAGGAGIIGPGIAKVAVLIVTTIAAATGVGQPASFNQANFRAGTAF